MSLPFKNCIPYGYTFISFRKQRHNADKIPLKASLPFYVRVEHET